MPAPVQRLDSVTDPEGQTTRLGYDTDFVHPCE
jgi:YD repeat-containing protein